MGLVHQVFEFDFVDTVDFELGLECGRVGVEKVILLRKIVEFVVHVKGLKVFEEKEDERLE